MTQLTSGYSHQAGLWSSKPNTVSTVLHFSSSVMLAWIITEEEVRAIAATEGLVLVPAPSSSTGYKGVTRTGCVGKPFKAQARQDGGKKNLGHYATAAEASLAYVRHLGPDLCAVEAWRATTTAIPAASSEPEHTAQQLAASEGLVLVPAPGTATGYKGVTRSGSGT